jgi:hypothetical protein
MKRKVHRMNIELMGENNIHKNTKKTDDFDQFLEQYDDEIEKIE